MVRGCAGFSGFTFHSPLLIRETQKLYLIFVHTAKPFEAMQADTFMHLCLVSQAFQQARAVAGREAYPTNRQQNMHLACMSTADAPKHIPSCPR